MTVAAVILATGADSALADADGLPAARRIADVAWSGGATPIVVVSADPDGGLARALAGASVTLAEPAPGSESSVARFRRGVEVAGEQIRDTSAALLWPARMTWVGAETVTSLIEAHGLQPRSILRPTYHGEAGWPVLLPALHVERLSSIPADSGPDVIVASLVSDLPCRDLDLGDPGSVLDRETPSSALPTYEGPPEPAAAQSHEWGAALAAAADDAEGDLVLEGPALAPYSQAEDPEAL